MKKGVHKEQLKTILVTGCAGFIGSHLCERLLILGYEVVGIDNFDSFYSIELKKENLLESLMHKNFTFFEIDLRIPSSLDAIDKSIDLVIHLAGKAGVRPSIEDPQSYIDNNITATQNVLEFIRKEGIQKLAFASSSSVYGNNSSIPFTEAQNVDKVISPYAFSKVSCEVLNQTYHHLYGIDIVNMRFFTAYGPRQRPDLAIYKFIKLMTENTPIPVYGDGSTSRDYTYIDDVIDGILGVSNYLFKTKNVSETINIGSSRPISLNELIDTISNVSGIEPIINRLPSQSGDVCKTWANISKAKQLIEYEPNTSFSEGIRAFCEWFNAKRESDSQVLNREE